MKELILDIKTWRCGGDPSQLGKGMTSLLNPEGYMCCLGQFSCQLGLKKTDILDHPDFDDSIDQKILGLNKSENGKFYNTILSEQAIEINDDPTSTPREKIKELKKIFSKNGFRIKIKNEKLLK